MREDSCLAFVRLRAMGLVATDARVVVAVITWDDLRLSAGPADDLPVTGQAQEILPDLRDGLLGIVGVRGRVRWGETAWFSPYYFDIGGGSSSLTWQTLVGVGYAFKWGDAVLAYRTAYFDLGGDWPREADQIPAEVASRYHAAYRGWLARVQKDRRAG